MDINLLFETLNQYAEPRINTALRSHQPVLPVSNWDYYQRTRQAVATQPAGIEDKIMCTALSRLSGDDRKILTNNYVELVKEKKGIYSNRDDAEIAKELNVTVEQYRMAKNALEEKINNTVKVLTNISSNERLVKQGVSAINQHLIIPKY